ncbi:MAG: DUF87 domain-containing protein [Candidatus Abawacabacteria bacterium]|nr:DUF87 domain-containing protein [Candidatus Abawacabacteria bacterium]
MTAAANKHIALLVRVPQGDAQLKKEKKFEELLISLKKSLRRDQVSLEIVAYRQHIYFYVYIPAHIVELVEGQIYSLYPDCEIVRTNDYVYDGLLQSLALAGTELRESRSDIYSFKTFPLFEGDSLASLFSVLTKGEKQDQAWVQMVITPIADTSWFNFGRLWKIRLRRIKSIFRIKNWFKNSDVAKIENESIQKKISKDYFSLSLRLAYLSDNQAKAEQRLRALIEAFSPFNTDDLNSFKSTTISRGRAFLQKYKSRSRLPSFQVNTEELASLYHFPNADMIPHIVHVLARRAQPPLDLPVKGTDKDENISLFGTTNFHNQNNVFGIKRTDRQRHLYIIGKSGVGKSKLLELLINQDVLNGKGVAVMDPHGDLIDNVMRKIPESRLKDVIYFDPADTDFPIAFNPLEQVEPQYKMRVTIGFIEIFKKLFGSNWTPRLEHVLRYTTLALLDSPNTTVLSIVKMLTDKNYRQKIVARIEDSVVKNFWVNEFAGWSEKFDNEAIMPVLNKVGQFISTALIRNMVGQPENKLNLRTIMDGQKILLVKLSRGLLGDENSNLLGAMLITKIQQAAMSRADILETERKDFYLYVDEFQNFATDTFEQILSEARKYRLTVTLAHQFMAQLSPALRATVFGNVGSVINFRVGADDAVILEKEYTPVFKVRDIINLGVQEFYIKMSIDGETRDAFSGKTLSIQYPDKDFRQLIIDNSRKVYGKPRKEVEEELAKWSQVGSEAAPKEEIEEEEFAKPLV